MVARTIAANVGSGGASPRPAAAPSPMTTRSPGTGTGSPVSFTSRSTIAAPTPIAARSIVPYLRRRVRGGSAVRGSAPHRRFDQPIWLARRHEHRPVVLEAERAQVDEPVVEVGKTHRDLG